MKEDTTMLVIAKHAEQILECCPKASVVELQAICLGSMHNYYDWRLFEVSNRACKYCVIQEHDAGHFQLHRK